MKVFNSIRSVQAFLAEQRIQGREIGLIPTMGALHRGHFKLVRSALQKKQVAIASIFVNPTQFNKKEDLEKYPRNLEKDIEALETLGCHAAFIPEEEEMYPSKPSLGFNAGYLDDIMEGKFRPGHFSGVALVVSKLFNIVAPNRAYFGQKDLQQLVLIRKLVEELNFNIEIVGVPTQREESGLAMSSRNERLTTLEKKTASNIYAGLKTCKDHIISGMSLRESVEGTKGFYDGVEGFELEYLEVVNTTDLLPMSSSGINKEFSICVAGYVAGVRLLDNICVQFEKGSA